MALRLTGEVVGGRASLRDVELDLLLEGIFRRYGYDFRHYARDSLERRLWRRVQREQLSSLTGLLDLVLHDESAMQRLLSGLSVSVTSMFRDPSFYTALREHVVPVLRTYPSLRVWNAGCATGEEAYSLAILLHEAGLYGRSRIYATDLDERALVTASQGMFPLAKMREYTANYLAAGGGRSFSDYYLTAYDRARFHRSLARNIVFSQHDLVADGSFNEFHLIVCRNVLIYFDRDLQERVLQLFWDSLVHAGVLALGPRETLRQSSFAGRYRDVDPHERIFRRAV